MRSTTLKRRRARLTTMSRLAATILVATAANFVIMGAPAQAGSIVGVPQAATGMACSLHWHYITHGETGLNVRPDPTMWQGSTELRADAVPGTDYWNQQFLFCRDPAWAADTYAIHSNLTKYFWSGDGQILYAGAVDVTSRNQLFAVWRYDSTWWVIDSLAIANVFNPYVAPDRSLPQNNNRLTLTSGPLNGNHLFKISPGLMG